MKSLTLTGKTIINALASAGGFLWTAIVSFVALPSIVHSLGNQRYGILAFTATVLGFAALLDLGISTATVKYIADAAAMNQRDTINRVVSTAFWVLCLMGCCTAVILAAGNSFMIGRFLRVSPGLFPETRTAMYLLSPLAAATLLNGVFAAILKAYRRYVLFTVVNATLFTGQIAATLIVLHRGHGLPQVMLINITIAVIGLLIFAGLGRRTVPGLRISWSVDVSQLKRLLTFGGYVLVAMIASAVLANIDKLLVGHYWGAGWIAFYTVPGSIAVLIQLMIGNLAGVLLPLSSHLSSSGQNGRLLTMYRRSMRYVLFIVLPFAAAIVVLAPQVMAYWMGAEYGAMSGTVLALLTVSSAAAAVTVIPSLIVSGMGKPNVNAFFAVASASFNVVLCLVLIPRYGITGAAAAQLANIVLVIAYLLYIEHRVIAIGWDRPIAGKFLKVGFAAAIQCATTWWAATALVTNFPMLIGTIAGSMALFYFCLLLFGLLHRSDWALLQHLVPGFNHRQQGTKLL